jgi:hypothetical protein
MSDHQHHSQKPASQALARSFGPNEVKFGLTPIVQSPQASIDEQQQQQHSQYPIGNVSEVVIKAKKAAVSLWTILHAQSCALPSHLSSSGGSCNSSSRPRSNSSVFCPHSGCGETKKVLLHIKSCPSAFDELPCPTNVQGCHSVRKLLGHYKACREMRRQQHRGRSPFSKASERQQQHQCLVCSLVARHARNVLEGGKGPMASVKGSSAAKGAVSVTIPAKLVQSVQALKLNTSEPGVSASLQTQESGTQMFPQIRPKPKQGIERTESMLLMPPPPPRTPLSSKKQDVSDLFGTPPSMNQLSHPGMVSAANATFPAPLVGAATNPSLLGKSVDSSSFFTGHQSETQGFSNPDRKASFNDSTSHSPVDPSLPRPRSFSVDERSDLRWAERCLEPTRCFNLKDEEMVESEDIAEESSDPTLDDGEIDKTVMLSHHVRRSSSCGMLSSLVSSNSDPPLSSVSEEQFSK